MQASAILTIARWELATHLRNRWVWTVGLLFLLAALTIAFFGSAPVGMARGQSGGAVLASLMNLSVYLVPLLALILGAGAIIDEKRRGTLDLILAYPVTPSEFFFGSFLGYGAALWLALLASFIPAGIAVMAIAAVDPLEYLRLVAVVLILGAVFLALAILLSLLSRNHDRGMASSMLLWIVAVFVFDLVLGRCPGSRRGADPANAVRIPVAAQPHRRLPPALLLVGRQRRVAARTGGCLAALSRGGSGRCASGLDHRPVADQPTTLSPAPRCRQSRMRFIQ